MGTSKVAIDTPHNSEKDKSVTNGLERSVPSYVIGCYSLEIISNMS